MLAALVVTAAPVLSAPPSGRDLMPEAERPLKRMIMGLEPNQTRLFMLPTTEGWDLKTKDPRVRWLRRQLYRLTFELGHGQIFRFSPPHTRFYIAVPDPRTTPESLGNEEEILREHLRERIGWSDAEIAARVRFFTVPSPVPFPQDMAEPMGYDQRGRLILGVGSDVDPWYEGAVDALAMAYPDEFIIRRLPGVNTEGGDLALVRLPEGGVGLLLGHNRVRRWVERTDPNARAGGRISEARIEQARLAYQRAFDGTETIVIGREALLDPRLANSEIFHLDMVVAVLQGKSGIVAFVPTYVGSPVDASSHSRLPDASVRRFQAEYDRTAHQLAARGYRVVRVPFSDHPARNPVGVGKFEDPTTGEAAILLGRYPDHLADSDERNAQAQLQRKAEALDAAVEDWRRSPTAISWSGVQTSVAALWRQLEASVQAPNADFNRQRSAYEAQGIRVDPIPIFPTGEGGIHCLVLK
jgi:hypothetical protein